MERDGRMERMEVVRLNVYDMSVPLPLFIFPNPLILTIRCGLNAYSWSLGLGIFHAGVELHGTEWAYGGQSLPPSTSIIYNDDDV